MLGKLDLITNISFLAMSFASIILVKNKYSLSKGKTQV